MVLDPQPRTSHALNIIAYSDRIGYILALYQGDKMNKKLEPDLYLNLENNNIYPGSQEDHTHVAISKDTYNLFLEFYKVAKKANSVLNLNQSLLRIHRQRSNKERKIPNATNNKGYIILKSGQLMTQPVYYMGKDEYGLSKKQYYMNVETWATTIQTPLSIELPYEDALFAVDFQYIIDKLHLDRVDVEQKESIKDKLTEIIEDHYEDFKNKNLIIDRKFEANTNHPYWNLKLVHTKAVSIPKDMWNIRDKKERSKKNEKN